MDVKKIYQKLLAHFGPQGWWPIFNCRISQTLQSFEICVGAILTQNTAWKNVEKALGNIYGGNLTPKFILSCKNLEKLIQPAGYYNQKAKKLRLFSEWWLSEPKINRKNLLDLWGVGPETADSMLLYAFNKPIFVIDAYTKRLCKECGVEFNTYDDYRHFFESQLPKSAKLWGEYHALIVAWGKLHAKNRPAAIKILD